ncbi:hypothetical protein ACFW81_14945 [Streptomyces angustmyceticus]|uniref:hypothetical protein n=1 Tax=Streptomyces angustmyceticus TaxID=285578 RepID=UPI0036CF3976
MGAQDSGHGRVDRGPGQEGGQIRASALDAGRRIAERDVLQPALVDELAHGLGDLPAVALVVIFWATVGVCLLLAFASPGVVEQLPYGVRTIGRSCCQGRSLEAASRSSRLMRPRWPGCGPGPTSTDPCP